MSPIWADNGREIFFIDDANDERFLLVRTTPLSNEAAGAGALVLVRDYFRELPERGGG